MFLVSSCSCLLPIQWSQALSREWRCTWSSADRRCSNYSWVIDNYIAYSGASYIRDLAVIRIRRAAASINHVTQGHCATQYPNRISGLFQHSTLQWRHNGCDGVSNHRRIDCLLNCLFRRRWKKTPKLHITGLFEGNSPGIPPHKRPTREIFPFEDVIMDKISYNNIAYSLHWNVHMIFQFSWRLGSSVAAKPANVRVIGIPWTSISILKWTQTDIVRLKEIIYFASVPRLSMSAWDV